MKRAALGWIFSKTISMNQSVLEIELLTYHDPYTIEAHGIENLSHTVIVGMEIEDEVKPGLLARKARRVFF